MSSRRNRSYHSSTISISPSSSSLSSDEDNVALPQRPTRAPPRLRRPSRLPFTLFVITIASFGGLLHCAHVAHLHENHLSFAFLSNTEREMTFRSEMAFYYSFYKQILLADNFLSGVFGLFNDTVTEYPATPSTAAWNNSEWGVFPNPPAEFSSPQGGVRVLERFNVYPEVILAGLYGALRYFNLLHSECFQVAIEGVPKIHAYAVPPNQISASTSSFNWTSNFQPVGTRGGDRILNCEGSAEPPIFYVNSVFSLTGLTVFGLVLTGWQVANSGCSSSGGWTNSCGGGGVTSSAASLVLTIWGAVLPLVGFFFNHGEATRVQWTPPLRESFAYPFFVVQQCLLIYLLRDLSPPRRCSSTASASSFCYALYTAVLLAFQLPWQFAQFALLTQLAALMATYTLVLVALATHRYSDAVATTLLARLARVILETLGCQAVALVISWVAQFGNRLLVTAAYFPCLIGCICGLSLHWYLLDRRKWTSVRPHRVGHLLLVVGSTLASALAVRLSVLCLFRLDVADGGHIIDLVKVKLLGSAPTFHTLLYTCAGAFDFMPLATLVELTKTGLLPGALLALSLAVYQFARSFRNESTHNHSSSSKLYASTEKINRRTHVARAEAYSSSCTSAVSAKTLQLQEQVQLARAIPILTADVVSLFVIFQLLAFTVLAVLVLRLKLFFTPQLCLTLAVLAQPRHYFGSNRILSAVMPRRPKKRRFRSSSSPAPNTVAPSLRKQILIHSLFVIAVAVSSQRGMENLRVQWSKKGQFSDFTMETMLQWAADLPEKQPGGGEPWVFTGSMPTMATLRASLLVSEGSRWGKFVVTNHPHYENAGIRWRTELAYAVCSRKPAEAVWHLYRRVLGADFVVIERDWCLSPGARTGCSSVELWDVLDPALASPGGGPLCAAAFEDDGKAHSALQPEVRRYFAPVFVAKEGFLVVWRVAPGGE